MLLLCVVPYVFSSISARYVTRAGGADQPFQYQALGTIVHSAGAIALVLFVIWRSGEPFSAFGLDRFEVGKDLFGGVGAFVLGVIWNYVLWYGLATILGRSRAAELASHDLSAIAPPPSGRGAFGLLVAMSVANGFAEELVMRAYLIPRFERLLGSTAVAVMVSAILFAGYHSYQGSGGIISALTIGLVYGGVFCAMRRAWPVAVGHSITDIIALAMMRG